MFIADRIDQNEIAARIMDLINARGYPALFENLTNAYDYSVEYLELMVAATTLSLQRHAKPGEDPLAKLDIDRVPAYAAELIAERDAIKAGAQFSSFKGMRQLLTTYPDKARIRYQKQFSYKGVNYSEHPIQKTYSTVEERRQITDEQHMAHAMSQLTDRGILFHESEVEAAFKAEHYSCNIPVIQFVSRFRSTIGYSRYSGEIQPFNYMNSQDTFPHNRQVTLRIYDRYTKLISEYLNGHEHIELLVQPAINLSLSKHAQTTRMTNIGLEITLTVRHLDHHLREHIEQPHISAYGTVPDNDMAEINAGRHSAAFEDTLDDIENAVMNSLKSLNQKALRRYRKREKLGDNSMSFDLICQELIAMVAKQNPDAARKIIEGELKFFDLTGEQDMAQRNGKAQKARIGFTSVDGKMQASFRLSSQHSWNKNSLLVPEIPDTIGQALVGMPATEVLEHPIAKLLGTVRTVRPRGRMTKISFNSHFEDMSRDEMREKISRTNA